MVTYLIKLVRFIFDTIVLTIIYTIQELYTFVRPQKSIEQQVVLVTGSGSGLGRLIAFKLAKLKARLVLIDTNGPSNEETAELIRTVAGAEASTYTCDLSDREEIYRTADTIQAQVGDVDILVNNARMMTAKSFMDTPDEIIVKTMEVNCLSQFWTLHAFLPKMMEKNQGHIVTVASAAGILGSNRLSTYCASMHGAVGLHKSLAMELDAQGLDNIQTTLVCPYHISTEMAEGIKPKFHLLLPILEPEVAANRIVDAILRNRSFVGLPAFVNVLFAVQGVLPTKVAHFAARNFGAMRTIEQEIKSFTKKNGDKNDVKE